MRREIRRLGALLLWFVTASACQADREMGGRTAAGHGGVERRAERPSHVLEEIAGTVAACQRSGVTLPADPRTVLRPACTGIVYVRSHLMPLSDHGITEIRGAASDLGLPLTVMDAEELYTWLASSGISGGPLPDSSSPGVDDAAAEFFTVGATVHFPAVVIHRQGRVLGEALLGFKTRETYTALIGARLTSPVPERIAREPPVTASALPGPWRDVEVEGRPGAYFKWIPGGESIAYSDADGIAILDLRTGTAVRGPGYVDFVPTPDGRAFVTPAPNRGGLEFYDADAVKRSAREGGQAAVEPAFVDATMHDHYPSVGILRDSLGEVAAHRVLTSWFDQVVFRDYLISRSPATGLEVRPLGPPRPACGAGAIALPILSPNGEMLGARNELTGNTEVFRLDSSGECVKILDLGIPTGKIAFHPSGERIAYAIPRRPLRDGSGRPPPDSPERELEELHGVFVFDLQRECQSRIAGSEDASRLAFPEFVGEAGIAFLLTHPGDEGARHRFRYVYDLSWPQACRR